MAKRGRPKKKLLGTREDRIKYYRKKYKQKKKTDKTFGKKDSFKIRLIQVFPKTQDELSKFSKRQRIHVHRNNFHSLPGVIIIPEYYLGTDEDLVNYVGNEVGEGQFLVKSGYSHKVSKRTTWRWIYKIKVVETNTGIHTHILDRKASRIRHYWWYKQRTKLK